VHARATCAGYHQVMNVTDTTRALRKLPASVADTLLAVGLTAMGIFTVVVRAPIDIHGGGFGGGPTGEGHFAPGLRGPRPPIASADTTVRSLLVAAAFLPLAFRRRYPLTVLAIVTVVAAGNDLLPGPPSLLFLAPLIALYTVGTLKSRRTLVMSAAITMAVQLAVTFPSYGTTTFWADALRIVSMVAVAAALGDATRNRRAYVAEVEQRAAEAERTREEEARRRVDEERLRIARELHDITAHSLSIIAVQSGAAAHVIDTNPAEARRSLDAIRRTSKGALEELRAMLGVLRSAEESDAPLAPSPGLGGLHDLAEPLAETGVDVTLRVADDLGDVPAVVEASAYRIVQEALTNVVRHAGVCAATVTVSRSDDSLVLEIVDNGRGLAETCPATGHGLTGMRERAVALGGTFSAGPAAGGGFRVAATLPLGGRGGHSA
jgi:signal transduction histidine kinase